MLVQDAREGKLDRIYIAMSMSNENKMKELVRKLTDTTCSVLLSQIFSHLIYCSLVLKKLMVYLLFRCLIHH